jgi:serine/threonine protein kinase
MKNWLSKIFGKEQKPPHADIGKAVPPQPAAERTILAETGRTVLASAPKEPHTIHDAEAQVAAEWKVGDAILDTYEVKQIHTGGGMGLVYRAYHRDWKEELAVKSPRPDYFTTQDQQENFVRECVSWIGLGLHPHIVTCYYVRLLGGIPRVFAEYVAGGTLQERIKERTLYQGGHEAALERMLDVTIQFARGLHYAHEKGLLHQDVKPANVMITPEGIVKVTDFGLARARAVSGETAVTGSQQSIQLSCVIGYTPAYCSPEQAGKKPLTRRTDVWSWGVSVLEMFSGEVFWPLGTTALTALNTYLENGAEDDVIPRMPDGLVELLRECFREPEAERPRDMAAIVERLKMIYQSALGRSYMREEGQEAEATADVLNNQGLSFYNLGMEVEAGKCFEQALKANPLHLEATYDRGLHLWRSGKLTSNDVISQLMNVAASRLDDPILDYMMGLIHLERGDFGSAARIIASGEKMHLVEIGRALMGARDAIGITGGEWQRISEFEGHRHFVTSATISRDGHWGLSGSWDRTIRLWNLASGQCVRNFEGHILSGSFDKTLRLWRLDWDYEFPGCADWDEDARPYLSFFLTLHCPTGPDGFSFVGKPAWNEEHFQGLISQLQHLGYGWLRPEGVRRQLEKMTAEWKVPPTMPWEQSK